MYRFQTPQTKVANSARVEALTFYPNTGTVYVEFAVGNLDPEGNFTEHERVGETIPRSAVTPEMDSLATSVLMWVYGHLQSTGVLPEAESGE